MIPFLDSSTFRDTDLEKILHTITLMSNLFYEMVFVADLNDGKIHYVTNTSGLAKRVLTKKSNFTDINEFITLFGYGNDGKAHQIAEGMRSFYKETEKKYRSGLLFIVDLPSDFDGCQQKRSYKFAPLSENPDGRLYLVVGAMSLSSGTLHDTMYAINTLTHDKSLFDFNLNSWQRCIYSPLSDIERSVLSLSAEGLSVTDIATTVFRSQDAVKSIRKRIFDKLNVTNITEAIMFATNYKII